MKNLTTLTLSILALAPFCAGEIVDHTVSAATVFTDRGVITRTGTTDLKSGTNIVEFNGINDTFDPQTLRAGTLPDGVKITGISWQNRTSAEISNEQLAGLDKKIRELEKRRRLENEREKTLSAEKNAAQKFLERLRESSAGKITKTGGNNDLTEGTQLIETEISEIFAALEKTGFESAKIENELNELYKKRESFKIRENELKRSVDCTITVEAEKDIDNAAVSINYTTHNAGWEPVYDARIDSQNRTLELFYNAAVTQTTGEDWKNIKLALSTAPANIAAFPPDATPIFLSGHEIDKTKEKRVVGRSISALNEDAAPVCAAEECDDAAEDEGFFDDFSTTKDNGANVSFEIAGTQNISGGNTKTLTVARETFDKIALTNEAAPGKRNLVYLRADVKNSQNRPIIEGDVNIYRDNGLVGKSRLKRTPANAGFSLFAGTADGLSVTRETIPACKRKAGVLSSFKEENLGGEIFKLTNTSGTPQSVRLRAQIPVSETERVKISVLNKADDRVPATTPGFRLDEKTGFVTWETEVPGQSEKQIILTTLTETK